MNIDTDLNCGFFLGFWGASLAKTWSLAISAGLPGAAVGPRLRETVEIKKRQGWVSTLKTRSYIIPIV